MNGLFYNDTHTTAEERNRYEEELIDSCMWGRLNSKSPKPYISSRDAEDIFCLSFGAKDLGRKDVTADAVKNSIGIANKTWVKGAWYQKIAEFNKDCDLYKKLSVKKKILKIAELRNQRILKTMIEYNLTEMVYHCTIRDIGTISIAECSLDLIDVDNIKITKKNKNSIYFTDGKNEYMFNISKSTLYKNFNDIKFLKTLEVAMIKDPRAVRKAVKSQLKPSDVENPTALFNDVA